MAGIVGYGAYVPCYRIKAETIARQWAVEIDRQLSPGLRQAE